MGSAVIYCLLSYPHLTGRISLIDKEELEEKNLRRYALMRAADAGASKVEWLRVHLREKQPALEVKAAASGTLMRNLWTVSRALQARTAKRKEEAAEAGEAFAQMHVRLTAKVWKDRVLAGQRSSITGAASGA